MEKQLTVTHSEWPIMDPLWERPMTLMELVSALSVQAVLRAYL